MANKRIELLSSLLKGYDCVLDIGTDHGLVLKQAIDKGYIKKAIASDIGEKPLLQAKKNLIDYPVEFVLSNGFSNIKNSFDIAVIAGMGVYTIIDILKQPHEKKTYLLQANDKYHILRKFLNENGYKITDEYMIFDKFYYVILKVELGIQKLTKEDLYVGPILKTKLERKAYYHYQINRINHLLEKADEKTVIKYNEILSFYQKYI